MKTKSILIKDTTKEDRIRIVQEGLNQCGGPVISVMDVIIWAEDLWMLFMSLILTVKRNCVSSMRNTEATQGL